MPKPVPEEIAKALLKETASNYGLKAEPGSSVWDLLVELRTRLAKTVDIATTILESSPFLEAAENKLEGEIQVLPDGSLQVEKARKKRKYTYTLPPIGDLRKRAKRLGVDISHFGRKKKAILAFLDEQETDMSDKEVTVKKEKKETGANTNSGSQNGEQPDPELLDFFSQFDEDEAQAKKKPASEEDIVTGEGLSDLDPSILGLDPIEVSEPTEKGKLDGLIEESKHLDLGRKLQQFEKEKES